jgi:epoxyqueuosine reductase QueG
VFAVPHERLLTLDCYAEELFEACILKAKKKVEAILKEIETALRAENIKYYIASVAQEGEEDLLALFSFKYAAVNAGLGWIGKNDVLITEEYGPRVRLSAVLIDYHLCNQKRSAYIEKHGRKHACGLCMVICPCGIAENI